MDLDTLMWMRDCDETEGEAAGGGAAAASNAPESSSPPKLLKQRSHPFLSQHQQTFPSSLGHTAYTDHGSRDAAVVCVFLHGFTTNSYTTIELAQLFHQRHADVRTVTFDFYGGGASSCPKIDYTEAVFTQQLEDLLEHLDLERAVLIGNSMGAVVAASFAAKHPERVERLCLIGPGAVQVPTSRVLSSPSTMAARTLYHLGSNSLISKPIVQTCGLVIRHVLANQTFLKWTGSLIEREPIAEWCEQIEQNQHFLHGVHSALTNFSFYADRTEELYKSVGDAGVDTLLVWGSEDFISPPQREGGVMHEAIPTARTVLIPNAGHSPQYDSPEQCYQHIAPFIVGKQKGQG